MFTRATWKQVWKGKTIYRATLNVALQEVGMQVGQILDVGGTAKPRPTYRDYFQMAPDAQVMTLNIDADSEPDIVASAYEVPVGFDNFDAVWCLNTIEHLAEPERLFREMYRILKLGGKMVVNAPFFYRVHAHPDDYGRYTDSALIFFAQRTGFKTLIMRRVGMGPCLVATAQLQLFVPRPLFMCLVSMALMIDGLIKHFRPNMYESWPLGFVGVFEK